MDFKTWMTNEEQSQDALFMQTDKSTYPKPSSNAGLPKPSDGWLRGKGTPALFMKKKMKKESVFHEDIDTDPYERVAKEICYMIDTRPGSRGENSDRDRMDQEALKTLHRYFQKGQVDWHKLEETARNYLLTLYGNYSQEYIKTQEAKLDSIMAYIPKYFGGGK